MELPDGTVEDIMAPLLPIAADGDIADITASELLLVAIPLLVMIVMLVSEATVDSTWLPYEAAILGILLLYGVVSAIPEIEEVPRLEPLLSEALPETDVLLDAEYVLLYDDEVLVMVVGNKTDTSTAESAPGPALSLV